VVNGAVDAGELTEQIVDGRHVRGANDPIVFVDPHDGRYVDEAVALGDDVIGVDDDGKGRCGRLDPFASGLAFIERDGDDSEAVGLELGVQRLPTWQVVPTASPTRPRDEHLLLPADRRH
jgi:hypothetical protein